jgi:hypothetical protein
MTKQIDDHNDTDDLEAILFWWGKSVREADLTLSLLLDAKRELKYEQAIPVDQIDQQALRHALIRAFAPDVDNKTKVANLCEVLTNIPMLRAGTAFLDAKPDA